MGNDDGDDTPIQLRWTVAGCVVAVGLMVLAGLWGAPRTIQSPLDRIFYWSFVVFAVGLAELFVLLIVLTILGRLDLTQVFRDKEHLKLSAKAETLKQATVSLSRLQAFLWTLVVMTVFLHSAATHPADGIPTVPPRPAPDGHQRRRLPRRQTPQRAALGPSGQDRRSGRRR